MQDSIKQPIEPLAVTKESQPGPTHDMKSDTVERAGKIRRKSKKARSVVTPGINRAAIGEDRSKLSVITSHEEEMDIFDGTFQYDQYEGSGQSICPKKDSIDVIDILPLTKSKIRCSTKDKQKAKSKAVSFHNNDMVTEDLLTHPMSQSDKTHSMEIPLPSVTFDQSKVMQKHHKSDENKVLSDKPVDKADLCTANKDQPIKVKGRSKKSSNEVVSNPVLPYTSEAYVALTPSYEDKGTSRLSRRGQKRMGDEDDNIDVNEEDKNEDTGRRTRRVAPVSYKEPSLIW